MSVAKAGAGFGAAALVVGGGGYGIYDVVSWSMPSGYVVLSKSSKKDDYTTNDKAGKDYGRYLIGVYDQKNEKWWNWSYRWWQYDLKNDSSSLSDQFLNETKIKSAFSKEGDSSTDAAKALNRVCETLYKGNTTDITPSDTNDSSKTKLNNNFWKYCSFLGKKPITIEEKKTEKDYGTDKYGNTKKSVLISTKDSDLFWEVRNSEFFGEDSALNGSALENTDNSVFHKLFNTSKGGKRGHIKDACEKSYGLKKDESGDDKAKEETVLKFCSLKGK
ncbi:hypothetical protein [Candidatus Mycoplasma haematohominis]|uniref:hypothetical protein n=1 Tax=Candidatus Mycoplasma haematohominis TaxID=1494318 RepID=UPI001C0A7650|nr:hypothetical protein [Candidatus Mycoplasma haemohominis]